MRGGWQVVVGGKRTTDVVLPSHTLSASPYSSSHDSANKTPRMGIQVHLPEHLLSGDEE
jgi:hypothetical protein